MPENGRNLYKKARQTAGVTQERAAELLNLGVRTLADYETGQRRPPAQTVTSMAAIYGAALLALRCVAGTKKCRPDVGASERRGEKRKGQRTLDGNPIVPQNAAKCNPFSGGGAKK